MSLTSKTKLNNFCQQKKIAFPKYITKRCGGQDHDSKWKSIISIADPSLGIDNIIGDITNSKVSAENSVAEKVYQLIVEKIGDTIVNDPETDVLEIFVTPNFFHSKPQQLKTKKFDKLQVNKPTAVAEIVSLKQNNTNSISALKIQSLQPQPVISISTTNTTKTVLLVDTENLPKLIEQIPSNIAKTLDIYAFVSVHHPLEFKDFGESIIKIISPSTYKDGADTCIQLYTGIFLSQNKYDLYLIGTRDRFGSSLVSLIESKGMGWEPKKARVVTDIKHF